VLPLLPAVFSFCNSPHWPDRPPDWENQETQEEDFDLRPTLDWLVETARDFGIRDDFFLSVLDLFLFRLAEFPTRRQTRNLFPQTAIRAGLLQPTD
jgi:hypothetical protein